MRSIKQARNKAQGSVENPARDCRLSLETLEPRVLLSVQYSLTDLGTLGGDFSVALGINAGGQVVGYSGDDAGVTRAFLWENGAMSTLPTATVGAETSYAYGISDSGSIAGTMKLTTGEIRGFYFNGSTVTNIHTVANGYASYVWALNDAGQVVGNYNDGSHDHAFLWDSTDGMQALGTTYGKAYDINGAGRVAGQTLAGTGYNHACVFQSGTVTDIHALSTTDSSALGLNDVGQVVGWYRYQFNDTHAFVWDSISGMQDLGTLGDDNGMAWSINNSGQIVGSDYVSMSTQHAFIYENGAMTDLNSLIPAGTGWTLVTANDINDAGQIIGKGLVGGSSTWRAFLLTPVETELPAAGLTVSDITTADGTSHGFSVTYTDNVAVDVSTLDDDDIRVTGPNGFDEPAVFEGVDNGADGAVRVATYRIGAPGGSWDDGDNGAYSIVIASGAVGDTSGNYVAAGTLGQFSVVISGDGPAASGPKVMMHQPSVTTAGPLDAVEITFDTTVNAGTFAAADVSLTDPDGDPVTATVVTPVGAFTWRIDFPAQSAAGVYCLKIGPNIQDALGNPMNQDGDTVNGEPVDDVYTANLSIAVSDLKIDSHTPTAGQDSGIDHLEVTFSRAIAADTFTPADVQITGPAGAINVSSVSPVSGTVYRIAFAPQTAAGSYTVRIGPDIETADGVLMNQDGDGTPAEPGDDAYQAVLTIGASVPLEGIVIRSIGCEIANNVITVRAGQKLGGEPFRVLIQNMSADWDNVSLGYYLSTDANVTADDLGYPLTTGSVRLESGAYYEAAPTADSQSSQFFAPDAPGTYYLKVKANDAWSDLITLQVAAPANDSDTTATDSVNPEIRVSGLNPNKTSFQKNEPFRVEMLLTNSGEIDYVPDMINYEYNIGVPYYNVHDRAVIYQFRYNFGWSLGQDFDAPYIPAGSAATAAQVGTVFWSATEVDLKYLSNVYSNVANPYSDTYSQVITFTHAGSWPDGAKADLNIAMSLATAAEALPGDVIPFTLSIQNSGNQYSSGGNVALYRSADADFDTGYGSDDDALIDNYNDLFELPYLMPGETKTYSGVLVMPSEAGTYYFSAFADVGGNVSESNENNNQSQVFAITVGNAQATADVTYPPIGENTDLSDLNDATNRYIEVTYSYADPASIDGDEIALGGIGAGSVTIGKMDKIDDDTYRYEVKGDFQAGLVDVQIVADSFTNDSDQFNAAETESFGALPDLAPLQISADANAFAWDPVKKQFYYSGEFGMGLKPPAGQPFTPIIDADGMIGFDGNIVSFSGRISMDILGQETTLFEGDFSFDAGSMVTSSLTDAAGNLPNEFTVAGTQVKLTKIEFAIPDGGTVADTQLELQASIKLPDDMGGFELSIADPHKLIVSPTAGVSLSGGKLTLPDLEIFMFGGELKMIAKDMSVEYIAEVAGANAQPAALRFRGSVSLPYFYNATADFTGDDSYIEVTRLGGVDWYGTLSVEDIVIVPGQWEINNALLGMKKDDQGNYITECEAKMTFPTGIALGGKIHFINGDINFVELEADNINKPLGATGAFLQRIMGHVDHLSEFEQPPQPVSFGGSVGITAGPQITVDLPDWVGLGDKVEGVLVGLDLSADADENHLNGHGYLEIVSGLIQGNANVDVNWTHGSFNASADLNALQGLITAGASLFIDYSEAFGTTDIFAAGKGAVKIPSVIPLWGGVELGSANMKLQYRDDNTDNNDYLMGWGKILVSEYHNYYLTGGIKVGFDGSYQFVGGKEIIQFTAPDTKAQAKAILSLPAPQTPPGKAAYSADYLVEPNTPWLLMGADWENAEDNVTVEVTDPQGNVYAEDDLDSLDHIMIVDVMSDSYGKTVYVHEPEAGTWSVRFISSGDLTGMAISGVIQATPPAIEITGVDPDPASRKVTIEYTADWSDDDTVINLYYDTDAENADGLQLAGDIAPTTGGTQVWDTSDVPPGTYYMYAEIIDSTNAPVTVYWPTPIDIEEAPTSVEVDLGDGLAKSVVYTDADGTAVTVKLAKGQGTLSFTGENIVTTGSAKGIEVTGDALVLAGVNLTSSTDMTSLTVTTKAGNVEGTTIGPITGDSLGKLTGKQLDIIGDITLTGFLGSMAVDDVGPNVTVTANASAKGFALKANDIADNVEFDLTGTVKGIQAATYASGTIRADQIGQVKIAEGAFGAAVQAQIGDIMGISTAGDITGSITAGGAIKKIAAKSGSLVGAVVRAGTQLASLAAVNLDNAIISAGDDIQKINLAGDILGSHILGGYDIGADCLFGGGDSLSGGNVLSVTAKGTFAGSYIAAGILPNSPLTTFLPDVGEDSVEGGTIGKIKFAAIDYLNGGTAFGLYAATEIKPFKVGTELAQSQDDFVIG